MNRDALFSEFESVFNTPGERLFFAPGRINLIGEHIDYNGGRVLPCAISLGTYAVVRKRNDRLVNFYSLNFKDQGIIEISLENLTYDKGHGWANYPKGIINEFNKAGYDVKDGFDILYFGNIPNGSGLSSSASISVLTAWVINTLFHYDVSLIDCARYVQRTENEYIGVSTGIMDQFAIAMGKEDCAMFLDTSNLEFEYVPLKLEHEALLIMNTCKRRELVDSAYNKRREECDEALSIAQKVYDIDNLCQLTTSQLEAIHTLFEDEVIYKRARHAVTENERTIKAVEMLSEGNIKEFGMLMNASHTSLRDDYEVTGIELDTLVETAQSLSTTYGARVTGAGFGGCAIALVEKDALDTTINVLKETYLKKIGYEAGFYAAVVSQGVHEIIN